MFVTPVIDEYVRETEIFAFPLLDGYNCETEITGMAHLYDIESRGTLD